MAILFHQRLVSPPTVAMEKRFDDRFRSEAECTKAGRVKEKIYGYREDELEERKREKRMEGRKWVWCEIFDPGVGRCFFPGQAQGDANHSR